jgi:hypothetical protein
MKTMIINIFSFVLHSTVAFLNNSNFGTIVLKVLSNIKLILYIVKLLNNYNISNKNYKWIIVLYNLQFRRDLIQQLVDIEHRVLIDLYTMENQLYIIWLWVQLMN